jgi:hypothetical protein
MQITRQPRAMTAEEIAPAHPWLRQGLSSGFRPLAVRSTKDAAKAVLGLPADVSRNSRTIFEALAEAEPERALRLARSLRRLRGRSRYLAEAEAVLTARTRGWDAAAPLFAQLERRGGGRAATPGLPRAARGAALDLILPDPDRPPHLAEAAAGRIVVYTTGFGDTAPPPQFQTVPGLRFLCLTDRADLVRPGWETVACTPPVSGAAAAAAWCRILAHRALAEAAPAEASLYLAPDRWLVGNLNTLLSRWLAGPELAFWRHPGGADWHDLAEHHLVAGTGGAEAVLAQARAAAARELPRGRGAVDTGVIWRRHGQPEVRALMEAWWQAQAACPGGAEDISLYAALHDPEAPAPLRPKVLPAALGPAGDNAYVARMPGSRPPGRTAAALRRPLPVAFVYSEAHAASASSFLRGRQLSEIVAAHDGDRFEVAYTGDTGPLRDQVVVLTKFALKTLAVEEIAALAKRNVAVIGSWDDIRPDPDKLRATHASMTISHRQSIDFARLFPGTPAHLVTHHVNPLVRPLTPPDDRLRIGYFGFPANTRYPASLAGLIDVVETGTARFDNSWIERLAGYNCHWIVRQSQARDGWKPFLKGFLAARCGAVVAVGRDEDDALYYLGDDYPFYVRSHDPDLLEYDAVEMAARFGGPAWRQAREIMAQVAARSSDAQVAAEFRAMVEELTG